jgi:ubiquinone/menaquinone biosynthesis C-methylase UbiE
MTTTFDDAWAGDRVARWLSRAAGLERQLAAVADVLFAAAALRPGERVLDVGCGAGPTTRRAAREVGPTGRVTGLDISAEMLTAAAAQPDQDDAAPLAWVTADAATWQPDHDAFDVVLSRFGVMFFADPAAAFSRLATATRPGGRLAVAVWARRDESELFAVPLYAALDELRRCGVTVQEPPDDQGPFSLHDPAIVTALLTTTGWSDVTCMPHRLRLPLGGGLDPASAATAVYDCGPVRLVTAQLGEDHRAAVTAAITAALADHVGPDGHVHLGAKILVVTAGHP